MLAIKGGRERVYEGKKERHTFMNLALWQPGPADSADSLKFPHCSQTVAKQSQRTAAPTHNAADSLTSYCCAGQ